MRSPHPHHPPHTPHPRHTRSHVAHTRCDEPPCRNAVGVSLEAVDAAGMTPMHRAARGGQVRGRASGVRGGPRRSLPEAQVHVIRFLYEHGLDVNARTTAEQTPLDVVRTRWGAASQARRDDGDAGRGVSVGAGGRARATGGRRLPAAPGSARTRHARDAELVHVGARSRGKARSVRAPSPRTRSRAVLAVFFTSPMPPQRDGS